jgi:hypothetical protein
MDWGSRSVRALPTVQIQGASTVVKTRRRGKAACRILRTMRPCSRSSTAEKETRSGTEEPERANFQDGSSRTRP